MKILVTGFEPFGGESVNPSWMAVDTLPEQLNGAEIIKKRLPVVYYKALEILEGYINEYRPDVVLMSGQAGNSDSIRIERAGVNICEASIPDNDGVLLTGEPVVDGGPAAYFSTFPYRAMLSAVKETGIAVKFSYSAGAYLCNHILYGALHMAETKYPGMKAGFIHVPYLPEQVKDKEGSVPSMPLEDIAKAMHIFAEVIASECK
ncbi:MAG: pyroglutamyl-peptidase I [Clostridiaceae bacterium]|nr:pyroglutamyl-peptidase I [Clostridiaceae bacterium]